MRGPDERESTCGTKGSSKEEEAVRSLSTNIEILRLYGLIAVEGTLLLFVGKLVTTLFLEFLKEVPVGIILRKPLFINYYSTSTPHLQGY